MARKLKPIEQVEKCVHDVSLFKQIINKTDGYPGNPVQYFMRYYESCLEYVKDHGIGPALNEEIYTDEYTSPCAFLYVIQEFTNVKFFSAKDLLEICKIIDPDFELENEGTMELLDLAYHSGRSEVMRNCYEFLIKKGCKYRELLDVKREWFGLPETWLNDYEDEINQQKILENALGFGLDLEVANKEQIIKTANKFGIESDKLFEIKKDMFY